MDGHHIDLAWPITTSGQIAIHSMKDEDQALELIRHDLAHVMARAVQSIWPDVKVTIGPVRDYGWFYDFDRAEPFTPEDLAVIEAEMKKIIDARDPVRTEVWDRDRADRALQGRERTLQARADRPHPRGRGPADVLARRLAGPVPRPASAEHGPAARRRLQADAISPGPIGAAMRRARMLQRIYGVAFRNRDDLKAHMTMLEEAAKRDHRKLGREMDLFHMQEEAPGQIFWHPNGWNIYTTLQDYMRRKQRADGYVEVNTPQVVDRKLWEESGHWDKYQDNMFIVEVDEEHAKTKTINALKPMNCPCHVQIFNQGLKSYRDLPLRMAEFGSCNRYEPSGALHGIMRVRGFTQDDAHIFCTEDQIEVETRSSSISWRASMPIWALPAGASSCRPAPKSASGPTKAGIRSKRRLGNACKAAGYDFTILPGEGAFYGPKLEFVLTDAIGRDWQCGTLQVDPNLPERLDAEYVGADGHKHRPIMLHRAVLGSFERFIGILIESHAGKLPLWLAPRQVVVASIVSDADDYVHEVVAALQAAGVRAEADTRNEKINYKVREHSVAKVPAILAIGMQEVEDRTVSLRRLDAQGSRTLALSEAIDMLTAEATAPDLR